SCCSPDALCLQVVEGRLHPLPLPPRGRFRANQSAFPLAPTRSLAISTALGREESSSQTRVTTSPVTGLLSPSASRPLAISRSPTIIIHRPRPIPARLRR